MNVIILPCSVGGSCPEFAGSKANAPLLQRPSRGSAENLESVAIAYAKFLLSDSLARGEVALRDEWSHSRRRYSVGLSARRTDFADLTKRVALVSDTLLLSHDWRTPYRRLGVTNSEARAESFSGNPMFGDIVPGEARAADYGFHCPDLAMLGHWIIDAEPLLKSGLAWYLPSFSTSVRAGRQGRRVQPRRHMEAIDFLIRDGRAVDVSVNRPVENEVVRPILQIDLPFIGPLWRGPERVCVNHRLESACDPWPRDGHDALTGASRRGLGRQPTIGRP